MWCSDHRAFTITFYLFDQVYNWYITTIRTSSKSDRVLYFFETRNDTLDTVVYGCRCGGSNDLMKYCYDYIPSGVIKHGVLENPRTEWRFLARKSTDKWSIFQHAMFDYQRLKLDIHIYITDWWFGTFFMFPSIGHNHPNWLLYFSERRLNHQPVYDFYTLYLPGI